MPESAPQEPPEHVSSVLSSLNKAQYEAVTSTAKTVAILAGPGSGKTHTLTSRVVWLIREAGYSPSNVIIATFTVKAAREMRERVGRALGEECQKKLVLGTFHSIARRYLVSYGKRIGLDPKFGIADDTDSKAILTRICKRLKVSIDASYARSWISKRKSKGLSIAPRPEDKKNPQFSTLTTIYNDYQEQLERSNLLDYDDLLIKCVELLRSHPTCVNNVEAVLIDEYQDTNGIQYQLMKLLAQAKERITIVGDPDQSIYGWRSAEIQNLHRLLKDYPETDGVSLEENYRSSQAILAASLDVIQQDKARYQKVLLPVHAKGTTPVMRTLQYGAGEGEWIVDEIQRVVKMTGGMIQNKDIAILVRSAFLSRNVESALGKAGVQYRMIGGHKFYERKEIKHLVDYLRVVHQPHNNDVLARIINVPRRGVGEKTIKSLLDEAELGKLSLWSLITKHCYNERRATTNIRPAIEKKISGEFLRIITTLQSRAGVKGDGPGPLVELISQLINLLNFESFLKQEHPDDHEQRWLNVQEFVNLATDFVRDFEKLDEGDLPDIEDLEQNTDVDILGKFLANIALASDAQKDDANADSSSVVTISTIHAAKGLEWPVVFIPAVYDGSIPHSRSEDHDEERRLLYVAMTRAKAFLYLSYPLMGSQGNGNVELSPFVAPFADTSLANKGPSFNRKVIEDAAKILGRTAPSEEAIFEGLPELFATEDDRVPIHPTDSKSGGYETWQRPSKRKAMDGGLGDQKGEKRSLISGQRSTMQNAANFTMPSVMPGFMSAGVHQTALTAEAERVAKQEAAQKQEQKAAARRGVGQQTIRGFFTKENSYDNGTDAHPQPTIYNTNASLPAPSATHQHLPRHNQSQYYQPQYSQPQHVQPQFSRGYKPPTIHNALKDHRLANGQPVAQANSMSLAREHPVKHYANFSSSPQRLPSSPPAPPAPPVIQATSYHTTTFQSLKPGVGVRRPAAMGPAPTMDKLRKPFKPLTINRRKQ
ncbi:hypothetical protein VHEMI06831 [[Torrubiella] hemipterigena]|uniref:DNA 3'-5' helicase n=1 Tax=[Torrubiella] hemipterigena TaxID=1531966 RepID=A0A0A1T8H3_9HYPO|nr:hypothetical protein VHEMI06831 [[Torrubiella] hemipterigena]